MDDLTNSNPGTGDAATTETSPAATTGTVQTNGEANNGQGAPVDEGFTHVDPKTLPPQLRSAYDNMLRDYKEKTTKLSETTKAEVAKATDAFRAKAEFYDQFASREDAVQWWNEYVNKNNSNGTNTESNGDPKLTQLEQELQAMKQKMQQSEVAEITSAFAEAINEKGEKLNPQFDELNSIMIGKIQNGQEAEGFSLLRACIELSNGKTPQEKLANGYKEAKATYDAIFESGKKAGMGRLQMKVKNGTIPPSNSTGDVLSVTDKRPKNAREALEMAKRGQVVSRE